MYKLVASCSTMPNRVDNGCLVDAVKSILDQEVIVEQIFINYPLFNKRLQIPYPPVPPFLTAHPRITIVDCEDFGPVTKLYPLCDMQHLLHLECAILLFDDDKIYPPNWITSLYDFFHTSTRPSAFGYYGLCAVKKIKTVGAYIFNEYKDINKRGEVMKIPPPMRICIVGAVYAALYPKSILPASSIALIENLRKLNTKSAAYTNDDIIIAKWAHKAKIKLFLVPLSKTQKKEMETLQLAHDQMLQRRGQNKQKSRLRIDDSTALTRSSSQTLKIIRLTIYSALTREIPAPCSGILIFIALITIALLIIILPVSFTVQRHKQMGRHQ